MSTEVVRAGVVVVALFTSKGVGKKGKEEI
jgi:hypothetical protein